MLRAVVVAAMVPLLMAASCTRSGEKKRAPDPGDSAGAGGERAATGPAGGGKPKCVPTTGAAGPATWTVKTPCENPSSYFAVAVDGPEAVAPGAAAAYTITVTPGAGYKVNYCPPEEEAADKCAPYPVKLKVAPPAGVEAPRPEQSEADAVRFDKEALVMRFEARPSAAGEFAVPVEFKFAVCDDSTCVGSKVDFSFALAAR